MVIEHFNDNTLCLIEPGIIPVVGKVLKEYNPEMIIELGTYCGGFTKYLCKWFPEIPIYSIDVVPLVSNQNWELFRTKGNVTLILTNQLFRGWNWLPMMLSLPKRKFLFCDNGRKVDEINEFAPYLRAGDLLGVHDWGTEVILEDVKGVLEKFEDHSFNLEYPDLSDTLFRFWTKRKIEDSSKVPNLWLEKIKGREELIIEVEE